MARIVIVHGAFNELWGPNELKARWLPAVRDGLWHHGVEIEADDVSVCFYGDLFRHHPGSEEDRRLEQSRAGVADMLSEMGGDAALAALSQAAGEANSRYGTIHWKNDALIVVVSDTVESSTSNLRSTSICLEASDAP